MAKTTTTFSLRLTQDERALLEREAKRLSTTPAALGRNLLVAALQGKETSKAPAQLRQLSQKLAALEDTLARIDVNLYNAVLLGVRLAAGEEKLKDSDTWLKENLQGD